MCIGKTSGCPLESGLVIYNRLDNKTPVAVITKAVNYLGIYDREI